MNFICTHCGKAIEGISVVIDKTHFAHMECEKNYLLNDLIESDIEIENSDESINKK